MSQRSKCCATQNKETKGAYLATIPPNESRGFEPVSQALIPIVAKMVVNAPKD